MYDAIVKKCQNFTARRKSMRGVERKPVTFTIENGRGETYADNRPTLYGHHVYERGSVLSGQPLRQWMDRLESWEDAKALAAEMKKAGLKVEMEEGSTFIPSETLCDRAGLPHDEDY